MPRQQASKRRQEDSETYRRGIIRQSALCLRTGAQKSHLHRKNALFYKNQNGAQVGDLFMSLIHTCELSDANPFDYLTQLQRHAADLAESPRDWMPWNYCATLAQLDTAA